MFLQQGSFFKIILEIFKFSSCTPTTDYKIFKFSSCTPTTGHKILVIAHWPVAETSLLRCCCMAYCRYLAVRIASRFLSISFPFNCSVESRSTSFPYHCSAVTCLMDGWLLWIQTNMDRVHMFVHFKALGAHRVHDGPSVVKCMEMRHCPLPFY